MSFGNKIVKFISSSIKNTYVYLRFGYGEDDEAEQPVLVPPHYEAVPIKSDDYLIVNTEQDGEKLAIGVILKTVLKKGETAIRSFNAAGDEQAHVVFENNGSINFSNKFGFMIFKSNGEFAIATAFGLTELKNDGSIIFQNGAIATADGDIVTKQGVSLNKHGHIGNAGNPVPNPIESGQETTSATVPSGTMVTGGGVSSIKATGNLIADGDTVTAGKSFNAHVHDVTAIGAPTGTPK